MGHKSMALANNKLIPGSTEEDYIKSPDIDGVEVMLAKNSA